MGDRYSPNSFGRIAAERSSSDRCKTRAWLCMRGPLGDVPSSNDQRPPDTSAWTVDAEPGTSARSCKGPRVWGSAPQHLNRASSWSGAARWGGLKWLHWGSVVEVAFGRTSTKRSASWWKPWIALGARDDQRRLGEIAQARRCRIRSWPAGLPAGPSWCPRAEVAPILRGPPRLPPSGVCGRQLTAGWAAADGRGSDRGATAFRSGSSRRLRWWLVRRGRQSERCPGWPALRPGRRSPRRRSRTGGSGSTLGPGPHIGRP